MADSPNHMRVARQINCKTVTMSVLVLSVTCSEGRLPVFVCPDTFDQVDSDEFLCLREVIATAGMLVAHHFNVGTAVIRFMVGSEDGALLRSALALPNAQRELMVAITIAVCCMTEKMAAQRDDFRFAAGVSIELRCGPQKSIWSTNYFVHF